MPPLPPPPLQSILRALCRGARTRSRTAAVPSYRSFTSTPRSLINENSPPSPNGAGKPLNPQLTNPTSTLRADSHVPTVGARNAPPELLSAVEGSFNPKKDGGGGGGGQSIESSSSSTSQSRGQPSNKNPGSNEKTPHRPSYSTDEEVISTLEGKFKIEPLRRHGESLATMRSRLQYQSRKRGILETDLLLSTFADANLHEMTKEQLVEYDLFLDENDWDIYYWATQTPPATSQEYAEGGGGGGGSTSSEDSTSGGDSTSGVGKEKDGEVKADRPAYGQGEWAQTIGKKKEPYRMPPARWRDSTILKLIREHVQDRKASGSGIKGVEGTNGGKGGGLGRMPNVKTF